MTHFQVFNLANQCGKLIFKYLRTTSKRFLNDLKTRENIKNTFVKVSGGGRMGHLLNAKQNLRKDMKITNTVIFYVKPIVVQRMQYINQHFLDFPYFSRNKIKLYTSGKVLKEKYFLKRSLKWLIS